MCGFIIDKHSNIKVDNDKKKKNLKNLKKDISFVYFLFRLSNDNIDFYD